MLTLARRVLAGGLLAMAAVGAAPMAVQAENPVSCIGVDALTNNCSSGTVSVAVTVDGQTVTTTLSDTAGAAPVCRAAGNNGSSVVVPCSTPDGWWAASRRCYVSIANPQPAFTDPLWQGHTDGSIYRCAPVAGPPVWFWSATPPEGAPDVAQLAARVVQSLNLHGIGVGMAPTPTSVDAASIGIVGFPTWLWVATPTATTWGPASGSASAGGLTVSVTAKVQKVTWSMGDGSAPIVCATPGTPYTASYGRTPSPTCGYAGYQKQGTYTVSAVSHWLIAYTSNAGVSGTMTMDLTSSASLTVGELQTTVG